MTEDIPLLSPKPFADFTPDEYRAYITSLYQEPPKPAPPPELAVRLNDKGTPVITIRREPKWLTYKEAEALATEIGWKLQPFLANLRKKKVTILHKPQAII